MSQSSVIALISLRSQEKPRMHVVDIPKGWMLQEKESALKLPIIHLANNVGKGPVGRGKINIFQAEPEAKNLRRMKRVIKKKGYKKNTEIYTFFLKHC